MNSLRTLEDLKLFLSNKLQNEFKDFARREQIEKIENILSEYSLSDNECEYANPIVEVLEVLNDSVSHSMTMINASKAQEILLKRKNR